MVDVQHVERLIGHLGIDASIGAHLGEVADSAQQSIGNSRRAARAPRHFLRPLAIRFDAEQPRRALDDFGELVDGVELQPLHDAEAVAQWRGEQPRTGGGAHQREARQVELDRARRRPSPMTMSSW